MVTLFLPNKDARMLDRSGRTENVAVLSGSTGTWLQIFESVFGSCRVKGYEKYVISLKSLKGWRVCSFVRLVNVHSFCFRIIPSNFMGEKDYLLKMISSQSDSPCKDEACVGLIYPLGTTGRD